MQWVVLGGRIRKFMKQRSVNLDLIRCCAVWCVLSVHFFLNNGFYYEQIIMGTRAYIMILMRSFFMICVPLFLLLTGYLMGSKKLSRQYYFSENIIRIIFVYYVSSAVYVFASRYIFHEDIGLKKNIFNIIGVKSVGYGWYVEMYIGLYLLIPFLNILYQGLKTKWEKQCLIVVLLICTTFPSLFSVIDWNIASWWTSLYPITYYYIGVYIKEYGLHLTVRRNIIVLGLCVILFGTLNYYKGYASLFEWTAYNDWYSFENIINSVLVFLLLLHIKTDFLPCCVKEGIGKISELSFGIYLLSGISDKLIYPILKKNIVSMPKRLEWYIVVVPISFLIATMFSYVVNGVYKITGHRLYLKVLNKIE